MKKCVYCNTKLDKRDKDFCPYCGTNQTNGEFIESIKDHHKIVNLYNDKKICAGSGQDENVECLGDFIDTIFNLKTEMRRLKAKSPYIIRSNSLVQDNSRKGNHIYPTTGITEYNNIMDDKQIEEWQIDEGMKNIIRLISSDGVIVETGQHGEMDFGW